MLVLALFVFFGWVGRFCMPGWTLNIEKTWNGLSWFSVQEVSDYIGTVGRKSLLNKKDTINTEIFKYGTCF